MKVDTYYDVCCNRCGRHLSTDYNVGMCITKKSTIAYAKDIGWKTIDGKNVCPICLGADPSMW